MELASDVADGVGLEWHRTRAGPFLCSQARHRPRGDRSVPLGLRVLARVAHVKGLTGQEAEVTMAEADQPIARARRRNAVRVATPVVLPTAYRYRVAAPGPVTPAPVGGPLALSTLSLWSTMPPTLSLLAWSTSTSPLNSYYLLPVPALFPSPLLRSPLSSGDGDLHATARRRLESCGHSSTAGQPSATIDLLFFVANKSMYHNS